MFSNYNLQHFKTEILSERGKFLALDLGGTNFRVLLIELGENNYFHMDSEIFKVPAHIQTGKGSEVIEHESITYVFTNYTYLCIFSYSYSIILLNVWQNL